MNISDHRIMIKTLTDADKGTISTSHQTHIGLSKDFMDTWDQDQALEGYLAVKNYGYSKVAIYTNCITRKSGTIEAPKIKTNPTSDELELSYPSLIRVLRSSSFLLSQNISSENILFLLCFNTSGQPIVIISKLEQDLLNKLKNETDLVDHNNEIRSKVVDRSDSNFQIIKTLAQFISNIIETGLSPKENKDLEKEGIFNFKNLEEAKLKINKSIVIRQGQSNFRNRLLENYKYKCAITGCDIIDTLEACHIYPYMGPNTNTSSNGILLRSDLHTLLDRGKICLDQNFNVLLKDELKLSNFYKSYQGKKIFLPSDQTKWPSSDSIDFRLKEFLKHLN